MTAGRRVSGAQAATSIAHAARETATLGPSLQTPPGRTLTSGHFYGKIGRTGVERTCGVVDRHAIAVPAHDLHLRRGMLPARVFLLSPARCDGERAKLLLAPNAAFPLASRLRDGAGVELGEVFSFLSGLYFRGKLTYARTFADDTQASPAVRVITANRGLLIPETRVRAADLAAFARVDIAGRSPLYLAPLQRDIGALAESIGSDARIVLLGSIATGKYVDTLISTFGERVVFPLAFVGRGDMSRGGLLLRHAQEGRELEYTPVLGAVRTGKRPPRLEPVR